MIYRKGVCVKSPRMTMKTPFTATPLAAKQNLSHTHKCDLPQDYISHTAATSFYFGGFLLWEMSRVKAAHNNPSNGRSP